MGTFVLRKQFVFFLQVGKFRELKAALKYKSLTSHLIKTCVVVKFVSKHAQLSTHDFMHRILDKKKAEQDFDMGHLLLNLGSFLGVF